MFVFKRILTSRKSNFFFIILLYRENDIKNILCTLYVYLYFFLYSIYFRRNKSSKGTLFGNLLSRWKAPLYQDIVVKNDETSTYQELDLLESAYQNTALP